MHNATCRARRRWLLVAAAALSVPAAVSTATAAEPEIEPVRFAVDVRDVAGRVRALNGVQSGPLPVNTYDPAVTELFQQAGVALVRLPQDLGFLDGAGDRAALTLGDIFPDAAADPDDPQVYRFADIDRHLQAIDEAGAEPLWEAQYDIGADANSWAANGNQAGRAPRDPQRWARVVINCLRHFNDGWADGHAWDVRVVEFPNEPCGLGGYDCTVVETDPDTGRPGRRRMIEDFIMLVRAVDAYNTATGRAVRVAGLGLPAPQAARVLPELIAALRRTGMPLPIFSYHDYAWPHELADHARRLREALDGAGYESTPLWNTEWNWPLFRKPPEDLRGALDALGQSAYVAAHNMQVKTLVQDWWDAAVVYRAIRSAARARLQAPGESFYIALTGNAVGAAPGTPKPAFFTWMWMDAAARMTPRRLRVEQPPESPTLLAARNEDGTQLRLILAHFCPSRAEGCASPQPYAVTLTGVSDRTRFRATRHVISRASREPVTEPCDLAFESDAIVVRGQLDLWSVQQIELVEDRSR